MTFENFTAEMRSILEGSARQKAYNATGVDGSNQLFDFIYGIAEMGHALGEIVYKVVRYRAKKNPEDLVKVASWAFLAWRKHYENVVDDEDKRAGITFQKELERGIEEAIGKKDGG